MFSEQSTQVWAPLMFSLHADKDVSYFLLNNYLNNLNYWKLSKVKHALKYNRVHHFMSS